MRHAFLSVFLLIVAMIAGGCATSPATRSAAAQAGIDGVDVGPAPGKWDAASIKAFMADKLRDAPSAQYVARQPARKQLIKLRGQEVVCWQWVVWIKASNSYDGEVPFEPFSFFFRDGKIIAYEGSIPIPGDWRVIPRAG